MASDIFPAWRMSDFFVVDVGSLELTDQQAAILRACHVRSMV